MRLKYRPDGLKGACFMPPIVASHITGIRSSTGLEAEGWFIGLTLTPHVMLEKLPTEKVIKRSSLRDAKLPNAELRS